MKITFHDSTRSLTPRLKAAVTRAALHAFSVIPRSKKKPHSVLSISILGKKKMQELNYQFRKKNYPTDVLSFPRNNKDFITPLHELGDILICLPVAKKQATEYQGTLKEELERLTVHGLLHLHGYDHELNKTEAKKMFRLQEKILNSLPD
jgi:probable rRNA maturation factor